MEQRRSISERCMLCKEYGHTLTGDGFRKRCEDAAACAARVAASPQRYKDRTATTVSQLSMASTQRAAPGNLPPAAMPPVPRGYRMVLDGDPRDRTPAEALIALMQTQAMVSELSGPFGLSPDVTLPLQAAQARYVLFGKPGCGKSNSSAVMAENCMQNRVPVCVFDSLGNMWGLRCEGIGDGLRIPIVGGAHGDLPLNVEDAEVLAEIFAAGNSVLIDLSAMPTEDQQFFAARYFKHSLRVLRRPAHVIVEEGETIAPAFTRTKAQFASQGAATLWARQIRNFGVGWTFSTQRPQLLHPDIIDASSVFLPMQTTGDNAHRAIGKEATSRVGKLISAAILNELGHLRRGETWMLPSPDWLGEGTEAAPMRFRIRVRRTHDSTQVPQIGVELEPAPPLVQVDLSAFAALRPRDNIKRKAS